MKKCFLISIFTLFATACSDMVEMDESNNALQQKTQDYYKLGLELLNKGDSCMAYWNWSMVKNQWDKTFEDTISKYKLKECVFSQ